MSATILDGKYPAKAHCAAVAAHLLKQNTITSGLLYLESGKSRLHEDCDQEGIYPRSFANSIY
jgi:hypothetical protein